MTGPRSVLECLAWYVERDTTPSEAREQARRLLAKHGKAPAAPKASEPAKPAEPAASKPRAKREPVPVEVVELPEAKAEPKAYPLASRFAGLGAA